MAEPRSKWQTKELATAFVQEVRGAIPGASLQLEVLSKIIRLWCPQPVRILDLGCGDGVLGRFLLDAFPTAHVVFVDFSEPMLDSLREELCDTSRATIVNADFATPVWTAGFVREDPLDVIVSGFAIHHQPDDRKRKLYTEIHSHLAEGGVFLNLDHVASAAPSGEALFDSFFVDHLVRFHRSKMSDKTRMEIEQAYYHRPDKEENILAPVGAQCEWLREIGFEDVDCFFKVFELALFGGRKARRKTGESDAQKRA